MTNHIRRQALRFSAIIMLLLAAVLPAGAEMSVESFKALPNDMDARINYPEKDPNGRTCAIIKVVNPNTGFTFSTGTAQVMKTRQSAGEIWVYVQPGVKKLTVGHQDLGVMRDYYFPIPIEEATCYELRLASGTVNTYVEQRSTTGFLVITSVPTGADVSINGKWAGQTPFSKTFTIGDRVQYRVSSPLYHDEVGEIEINQKKVEVASTLRPAFGAIKVTTTPSGASVFLDSEPKQRGVTPLTINEVPSGPHRVKVQVPKYEQRVIDVAVADNLTAQVDAKLDATFAEVTVKSLPGAEIKANGAVKGSGTVSWEQEAGPCFIEVSLAGHRPASRQIEVQAGKPMTVTLEPIPMHGSLVVNSEPIGADIWLDGKQVGKTPDVLDQLLATDHQLKITMSGYQDYTSSVTVRQGQESTVNAKLQKQAAPAPIAAAPRSSGIGSRPAQRNSSGKMRPKKFTVNGVSFKMMPVEGGTFKMGQGGTITTGKADDYGPVHNVTVSSYYIGETEVTNDLWVTVMGGTSPARHKDSGLPVTQVTWDQCQEFLRRLSNLTGTRFRMPTEAEWEFAAKGGNKGHGYGYSGSKNLDEVAWHNYNSGKKPHRVATKKPNELGICDMTGNVSEWVADYNGDYLASDQVNPTGPTSGTYRGVRGGEYYSYAPSLTTTVRSFWKPDTELMTFGFRIAMDGDAAVADNAESANAASASAPDAAITTGKKAFTVESVTFNMVNVPGGSFTLGEAPNNSIKNRYNAHRVTLSDFMIGETEVTNALWRAVMGSVPSNNKGDNCPVESVSWNDCITFVNKLNQLTGVNFSLPTEAQWEYAAKGGPNADSYTFAGSNSLDEVGWYLHNSKKRTHPVAQKKPNSLGIYDMTGNVQEWCYDWLDDKTLTAVTNPTGPSSGVYKVYRGGHYDLYNDDNYCVINFEIDKPDKRLSTLGLRLALNNSTNPASAPRFALGQNCPADPAEAAPLGEVNSYALSF